MTDTHEDDIREDDVMVGFSNSAVSAAALRWAVAEGARIGCRVRVVHVYDEAERADARLEAAASQDASSIDPGRVLGRLGDAAHEACITVSQEGGDLEDTLRRASAGARVLAIGKPGDCRPRGLDDRLSAGVTSPVVPVPLG